MHTEPVESETQSVAPTTEQPDGAEREEKRAARRAELSPWLRRDLALFELINQRLSNPVLDFILTPVTHCGLGGIQILVILAAAGVVRDWPGVQPLLALCGFVFITASFGSTWTKGRLKRPRPVHYTKTRFLVPRTAQGSFPSGHTCTSFAFALVIGSQIPQLLGPLLIAASVIGYSRIYVGLHFPGDVLGAIVIAIFGSSVVLGLAYFAGWIPLPPLTF